MKSKSTNLLIVEDNPYIVNQIFEAVKNFDSFKNIKLAENVADAFLALKSNQFQLITLDLNLPDGNGLEILKWLKEQNETKKVFVFSANSELKSACLRFGATAFFDKSNGFDDLIETLKTA